MDVAAHRPQARTARLRPDYIGTVGVLRRADDARLKLARRSLREIPETEIEGQGLHLVEKSSGRTWEIITSFVDLVDVKQTGAEAFVIRDGWLVPLRPVGWKPRGREPLRGRNRRPRGVGQRSSTHAQRADLLMSAPFWTHYPRNPGWRWTGRRGRRRDGRGCRRIWSSSQSSRTADRPDFSRATSRARNSRPASGCSRSREVVRPQARGRGRRSVD